LICASKRKKKKRRNEKEKKKTAGMRVGNGIGKENKVEPRTKW
jgi:hypothetical protein